MVCAQQQWKGWARVLALAAVALLLVWPVAARANSPDEPPGDTDRVIVIGPQAVVVQNQRGELRMYNDPSQKLPVCRTSLACLGGVLATYGIVGYVVFDNLTVTGFENNQVTPPRLGGPSSVP